MLDLTAPCACGGTFDRPNPDCRQCALVALVKGLVREVYGQRAISYPWADADLDIAARYGLSVADVRRIVGRGEGRGEPCPNPTTWHS